MPCALTEEARVMHFQQFPGQDAPAKTRRRAATTHPIGGPSAELAPLNGFAHDRALAAIRRASS
jgi:hypothetical protein